MAWNYEQGYLGTSMANYVRKNPKKYNHEKPRKKQDCPNEPYLRKYGKGAQDVDPEDDSPPLSQEDVEWVQKVVGSFL